jgi:hypothetical protein
LFSAACVPVLAAMPGSLLDEEHPMADNETAASAVTRTVARRRGPEEEVGALATFIGLM